MLQKYLVIKNFQKKKSELVHEGNIYESYHKIIFNHSFDTK